LDNITTLPRKFPGNLLDLLAKRTFHVLDGIKFKTVFRFALEHLFKVIRPATTALKAQSRLTSNGETDP
jgi:hypothetical protein